MAITWERNNEGYMAWSGALKVAVLSTKHNLGLMREGRVILEPMDRSSWGIHFTSPAMPVDLIAAIIASIPTEA